MITEDYVSFETAKLLKEKGFDEQSRYVWILDKRKIIQKDTNCIYKLSSLYFMEGESTVSAEDIELVLKHSDEYHNKDVYLCPTLQMAMKWLREVHKLYINIWADPKDIENNNFDIIFRAQVYNGHSNYGTYEFSTYERACDAVIKYCLENLI